MEKDKKNDEEKVKQKRKIIRKRKTKNLKLEEESINNNKEEEKSLKKAKNSVKNDDKNEINTNIEFNLLEVVIIILITGIVVSLLSGLIVYNNYDKLSNKTNTDNKLTNQDLEELVENYNIIMNKYVDEVSKEELLDAAISGMYNQLGDAYTTYLNKDETDTLESQLQGKYTGIGVEIVTYYNETDQITLINDVFKDSPADKAGMKPGDILKKIDDVEMNDKDSSFVANYIKNGDKESFIIIVERDGQELTLNLERELVYIDSVNSKVDNNVGYIQIETFSNTTVDQVKKALDGFDKNVKSLIIDLRNNTGGILDSAYDTSDLFIEKDKNIYCLKNRDEEIVEFKAKEGIYRKFDKIIVLINENSASASEILTLALKESAGAKVIGKKSYGKGTVQETSILSSGAMVKYTTSYWLSPNGNTINQVGIEPDIEIDGEEEQYNEAIKAAK